MLLLVFQVAGDRFAIDASHTVEVLPLVHWKRVPGAPREVAGVFNYHGTPVPLLDLSELLAKRTSRRWMSTRIIVVNQTAGQGGDQKLLGLLAEQVTETCLQDEDDFGPSGIAGSAPYLGGVAIRATGMIQRIEVSHLLPSDVLSNLAPTEVDSNVTC